MKKQVLLTLILSGLVALITMFSSDAKEGAKLGWSLCENVIIPSLLPILILTNIIISSDCSKVFEIVFGKVIGKIFSVPSSCAVAIIFGLIGGYPAGAVLTQQLYNRGSIDSKTAGRVMEFNFSGGIGFIIMVVGKACYGNGKIGALLLLSNILASLIVGIVTGLFEKRDITNQTKNNSLPFMEAMTKSVETSTKSILNMCAYIILFSSVNGIISLPGYINPMLEITNGICTAENMPLDYCAFFLAFGGFCVHFQLIGIINDFGMKYVRFLLYRFANAVLSFGIMRALCLCFPETVSVFSNATTPMTLQFAQVNTGLSIIMVLGCAVLILDIEGRKLNLI